jgi:hypothetical protein
VPWLGAQAVQAEETMSSRVFAELQPRVSSIRVGSATSRAGSPGRRATTGAVMW